MKHLLNILTVAMLWLLAAAGAYAQDTRAQEAKKARLEREIAILDKQLAENASRSDAMLSNLTLIRKKISNRKYQDRSHCQALPLLPYGSWHMPS